MNTKLNQILAEISAGELLDKITILQIKKENIASEEKKENINYELGLLNNFYDQIYDDNNNIKIYLEELLKINLDLWDIEEKKRNCEKENKFDEEFIRLSRDVYIKNDLRYEIKNKINNMFGSEIIEEKSHSNYLDKD